MPQASDAHSLISAYTMARLSTKMADYMFRLIYEGGNRFRLFDGVTVGTPMTRSEVEQATLRFAHQAASDELPRAPIAPARRTERSHALAF